jgi:hypothetical protein
MVYRYASATEPVAVLLAAISIAVVPDRITVCPAARSRGKLQLEGKRAVRVLPSMRRETVE